MKMLQVARSNVFCLVLLLGNLYAVQGDTAGSYQPTLCKTRTETEGEMGVMEFSISPKINMTTVSLIYLQRSNDPADINLLECDAIDNKSTIPCDVHNEQFTTEGFTGRTLTVRIPKPKHELDGEYELKAFVKGDSKVISTCNLTVVMKAFSGAFESNSEVKIVVPIIVIVVVAVVIILVIVLIRRRNRSKEGAIKATPENQQLNTTANTTGISEIEADV